MAGETPLMGRQMRNPPLGCPPPLAAHACSCRAVDREPRIATCISFQPLRLRWPPLHSLPLALTCGPQSGGRIVIGGWYI